jgi:hypothetical protein
MLNLKKSLQISKSQVTASHQLQSNQSQLWEEISDTPAENIKGGWGDPGGGGGWDWYGGVRESRSSDR